MKKMTQINQYITNKQTRKIEHTLHGSINVYEKDSLPESIDLPNLLREIEKLVPKHMFANVDMILIGQNDVFGKRKINALYKDGAIYITNEQDDAEDMLDDIIHETAHSLEEIYKQDIYSDDLLHLEFLKRRQKLYDLLDDQDKPPLRYFKNVEYSELFDMYLLKNIGYEKLSNITRYLFPNPYSITSLREYFASGFEDFFLRDRSFLKKTCPILYDKIANLVEKGQDYNNEKTGR